MYRYTFLRLEAAAVPEHAKGQLHIHVDVMAGVLTGAAPIKRQL